MPKNYPVVPYEPNLNDISVETNEQIILEALSRQPVTRLYAHQPMILDTNRMYVGRPIMREKQIVRIEEIATEL